MDVVDLLIQADIAKEKLMEEASRSDMRLRVLVGHANYYDSITQRLHVLTHPGEDTLSMVKDVSKDNGNWDG